MWRLALLLLLGAPAALAQSNAPEPPLSVMVANRDIPAGRKLTRDDLHTRALPRRVISGSMMLVEDADILLESRVLEPLAAGEPFLWTHLSYGQRAVDVPGYCGRVAQGRTRPRAYPKRASEPVALIEVLVAGLRLPAGTELTTQHLVTARIPSDFAGPRAVRAAEATTVVGQVLTVPIEPGDTLRYTQLAAYASEPRCQWLKEDVGNLFVSSAPPDAGARRCPKGLTRVVGVPAGEDWTPVEPGYAVACRNARGEPEGPYVGWDRFSGKRVVEGSYQAGKRDGKWTFRHRDGKDRWEQFFQAGVPTGTWTEKDATGAVVINVREFSAGRRHGKFLSAEVRGEYLEGRPTGTWRILRGSLPAEVDMSAEAPPVRGAVALYARRDLRAGEAVVAGDFEEGPVDQMVASHFFLDPAGLKRVLGHPLNVNLPQDAPLAWEDVESGLRASFPVPAIAPQPQRLPVPKP